MQYRKHYNGAYNFPQRYGKCGKFIAKVGSDVHRDSCQNSAAYCRYTITIMGTSHLHTRLLHYTRSTKFWFISETRRGRQLIL